MQKYKLYSVFDSASGVYGPVMQFHTEAEALRAWSDAVNQEESKFNRHAKDFTLFRVGEFEDDTGAINPVPPVAVVNALQVLREYRDEDTKVGGSE